ncbi:MAG: RHS repeat-associated core domain-containing protein, partial [Pseudomonadota bacterium]|nr:RHS repeat-associated core domain-containing protein [Pseudomonadota bacterium]
KTTYDWTYRYDGNQPHAPTHLGDRTFSYDANGNQLGWTHDTNGTRRQITWDDENRIREIGDNGHRLTYTYDASGQRLTKRGPQGETGYINQWFTLRNGEVGTKHVYAGTTRIVSKLVKQDKPNSKRKGRIVYEKDQYTYHPDHLGTSAYITHTNGQVYQHLEYFPFGETWVEEHSNKQRTPYLFTAKELDEDSQLYYFGARYYDPRTSVWVSSDPILGNYVAGEVNGGVFRSMNLNLYNYAAFNPINRFDVDGNFDVISNYHNNGGRVAVPMGRAQRENPDLMPPSARIADVGLTYELRESSLLRAAADDSKFLPAIKALKTAKSLLGQAKNAFKLEGLSHAGEYSPETGNLSTDDVPALKKIDSVLEETMAGYGVSYGDQISGDELTDILTDTFYNLDENGQATYDSFYDSSSSIKQGLIKGAALKSPSFDLGGQRERSTQEVEQLR